MRYHALACDYDGTLARDGVVDERTIEALRRAKESGRRLLLVTGRMLPELQRVFPALELFDRVVAENGALLYAPASHRERALGPAPPAAFVERLRASGVAGLSVGRVIVATWEPHETTVLAAIRDLGLEWQVIFNKGAVMALPTGITKATGLGAALEELELSPHNTVAVGDAENDHHLLAYCECGVAVANAVSSLKDEADWVTPGDHGEGVLELIERLVGSDLADLPPRRARHAIPVGRADGGARTFDAYGPNLLLAGGPGGGKSTFATALLEQFAERGYQYCVIDPEGDYGDLDALSLGGADQAPALDAVLALLQDPHDNAVVNLLGVALEDRPRYFARLLSALLALRARTGRPHWLVVDETHHLLPASQTAADGLLPASLPSVLWITVYPAHLARPVLDLIDIVVAIGEAPGTTLEQFARARDLPVPPVSGDRVPPGEAVWWPWREGAPVRITTNAPRTQRRRHRRKYAHGELLPEESFYFRGPDGRLNLRAQNLSIFLQSAEGVDDDTWMFHLRRGDYSRWFGAAIKDDALAAAARRIERMADASPAETRRLIRQQIEKRYSAPA
ncbi:MAG TPA: HAD family hydrolase [Burkholderiales bacterium]